MDTAKKLHIIKETLADLELHIQHAEHAAWEAQQEANGHIGAMASRYDTFKEEAQYLSAAHRLRLAELRNLWQKNKMLYEQMPKCPHPKTSVTVGSCVTLFADSVGEVTFLILYYGTGQKVLHGGQYITIIGIESPIAQSVLGLSEGEEVEIILPQREIHAEIISIC